MHNLFTYGSLMFPAVWQQLVPTPGFSTCAFLPGFSRRLIFLDTYPLLIADAKSSGILGKIYYGLTEADIARLDWFEGEIYQRIAVEAFTEQGKLSCQTYVPKQEFNMLAMQDSWRGDIFRQTQLPIFLARYCTKNLPDQN
ncbi:MAG: gamma-glutamylcyclotransferase [Moraxellaceae bacterium]|nr:MAG: gamma-glutamylcyclotransferase [Moraxellaceae bacterium]